MRIHNRYGAEYIINDSAVVVNLFVITYDKRLMLYQMAYNDLTDAKPTLYKRDFKGVAKLKEGDVSDTELAKRIAYQKAIRQADSYFKNELKKYYATLLKAWVDVDDMVGKFDRKLAESDRTILRLTGKDRG